MAIQHFAKLIIVIGFKSSTKISQKSLEKISKVLSGNEDVILMFFGEESNQNKFVSRISELTGITFSNSALFNDPLAPDAFGDKVSSYCKDKGVTEFDLMIFYTDITSRFKAEAIIGRVRELYTPSKVGTIDVVNIISEPGIPSAFQWLNKLFQSRKDIRK